MPALAERTKIKTGNEHIPTTTALKLHGATPSETYRYGNATDERMEATIYLIGSSSIKVKTLHYLPDLSLKARDFLRKLYAFQQLNNNWDENGAVPPSVKVIDKAASFLTKADEFELPVYFTAPGPNGEIVLEYKAGELTAEVFFEEGGASEMILYKGKEQEYAGEISIKRLIQHLGITGIENGG